MTYHGRIEPPSGSSCQPVTSKAKKSAYRTKDRQCVPELRGGPDASDGRERSVPSAAFAANSSGNPNRNFGTTCDRALLRQLDRVNRRRIA